MVLLKQIHKDFTGVGISPMNEDQSLLSGRPFGGVDIVWRKSIDTFCKVKKYNDNRLIGKEIEYENGESLLFVNVYLPYTNVLIIRRNMMIILVNYQLLCKKQLQVILYSLEIS